MSKPAKKKPAPKKAPAKKPAPPSAAEPSAPEKQQGVELSNYKPDDFNANKGTERGHGLLEQSLRNYGAGRSILVDKSGRIVAGNKTHEVATAIGLKAVEVEVDGDTLVVVRRKDLDIDTPEGRALAVADNRVGEVNLAWDADVLNTMIESGVAIQDFFFDNELAALIPGLPPEESKVEKYTKNIAAPTYEPTREKKPAIVELMDETRAIELRDEIDRADISDADKAFLRAAATRHIRFSFKNIAEFYAHSGPEVQRLMEKSALVIIDLNKAIENGYAVLSEAVSDLIEEEEADEQ